MLPTSGVEVKNPEQWLRTHFGLDHSSTRTSSPWARRVAGLVPYMSDEQLAEVRDRAAESVVHGQDYSSAALLTPLVPYASGDQHTVLLGQALAAIPRAYDRNRNIGLHGVATALLERANKLALEARTPAEVAIVREFLRGLLRNRSRGNCLEIIAVMAPSLVAHGGIPVVEDCLAAISDVGRWWP